MLNQVTLVGRTCNDIELHQFESGACVGNVSLAVNEKKKDKSGEYVDHTEFVRCTLWNKTAELASKYVPKGRMICFVGKLQTSSYEKDGVKQFKTEVVVREMKFLPGQGSSDNQQFAPKSEQDRINSIGNDALADIPF